MNKFDRLALEYVFSPVPDDAAIAWIPDEILTGEPPPLPGLRRVDDVSAWYTLVFKNLMSVENLIMWPFQSHGVWVWHCRGCRGEKWNLPAYWYCLGCGLKWCMACGESELGPPMCYGYGPHRRRLFEEGEEEYEEVRDGFGRVREWLPVWQDEAGFTIMVNLTRPQVGAMAVNPDTGHVGLNAIDNPYNRPWPDLWRREMEELGDAGSIKEYMNWNHCHYWVKS